MAYTDIISLTEAKNYLRIDDGFTEDDSRITGMINASLSYLERFTNHVLFGRDKDYILTNGCVKVYDYPINSVVSPSTFEREDKVNYSVFSVSDTSVETITLNVGYALTSDIPPEIVECAYNIIKYYYYEAETNKANNGDLPQWIKDTIYQLKRFYV